MKTTTMAAAAILFFLAAPALAQTISLDTGFGANGVTALPDFNAEEIAIDRSGRILVAGWRATGTGAHQKDFAVARLRADGGLDSSFGTGGIVTLDREGNADWAHWVGVTSYGKIMVAGWADTAAVQLAVVRLNDNGSLDTSFGRGGWATMCADAYGFAGALTETDEVFVAGRSGNAPGRAIISRTDPSGNPDPTASCAVASVNAGGHTAYGIAVAQDHVIIGGEAGNGMFLARFHGDPTTRRLVQDTAWGVNGVAYVTPAFLGGPGAYRAFGRGGVARQADGKVLLAGWDNNGPLVLRFNPTTGQLDTRFQTGIVRVPMPGGQVGDIAATSVGVFLAAGAKLVCLGPTGVGLTSCGSGGLLTLGGRHANALLVDAQGRVVMSGSDGAGTAIVFRYSAPTANPPPPRTGLRAPRRRTVRPVRR